MSDWLYNLPVAWMALVVFVATYLVTAGIYRVVMALAGGERAHAFKAISPGMLSPLGVIFGLFVAFLAAQVWSDFDRAQEAVNREASALRAIVLLIASFPGEPEARMRSLVRRQIEQAAMQEWPTMSRHQATLTMIPAPLAEALQLTLALAPRGDGQSPHSEKSSLRYKTHSMRVVSALLSAGRRSTGLNGQVCSYRPSVHYLRSPWCTVTIESPRPSRWRSSRRGWLLPWC